jgi:hypothetical protein
MNAERAGRARADIGFAEALDGFDPADWAAAPAAPVRPRLPAEAARASAAATGFVSRQPVPVAVPPAEAAPERLLLRRRRTGRNVQFNLKARPETIEAYCAVADAMGWGLGETLEHAVVLLQREFGRPSRG